MNRYHMTALAALCMGVTACPDQLPKGPPQSLAAYPHIADRYARLLRQQLTDSNPTEIQQELSCEGARMGRVLGIDEELRRIMGVQDSIYANPPDQRAHARVEQAVSGRSYEGRGPTCDSLNAIADREDPIVKSKTSPPPRDSTP